MKLNTCNTYKYFERPGFPAKILVQAILNNSSKETRFFWIIFDWNDSQNKIMGILQKHWKITAPEATAIADALEKLKNNPTPASSITAHSFSTPKQIIQIMTPDLDGKRLILSSPVNKKFNENIPSDKRWNWISNRLDPIKLSIPAKDDLLNILGCSIPEDRIELISKINLFFDSILTPKI